MIVLDSCFFYISISLVKETKKQYIISRSTNIDNKNYNRKKGTLKKKKKVKNKSKDENYIEAIGFFNHIVQSGEGVLSFKHL